MNLEGFKWRLALVAWACFLLWVADRYFPALSNAIKQHVAK